MENNLNEEGAEKKQEVAQDTAQSVPQAATQNVKPNKPLSKRQLYVNALLITIVLLICISAVVIVSQIVKNREFPVVGDNTDLVIYSDTAVNIYMNATVNRTEQVNVLVNEINSVMSEINNTTEDNTLSGL